MNDKAEWSEILRAIDFLNKVCVEKRETFGENACRNCGLRETTTKCTLHEEMPWQWNMEFKIFIESGYKDEEESLEEKLTYIKRLKKEREVIEEKIKDIRKEIISIANNFN